MKHGEDPIEQIRDPDLRIIAQLLQEQTRILQERTQILQEHSRKLDKLDEIIAELDNIRTALGLIRTEMGEYHLLKTFISHLQEEGREIKRVVITGQGFVVETDRGPIYAEVRTAEKAVERI